MVVIVASAVAISVCRVSAQSRHLGLLGGSSEVFELDGFLCNSLGVQCIIATILTKFSLEYSVANRIKPTTQRQFDKRTLTQPSPAQHSVTRSIHFNSPIARDLCAHKPGTADAGTWPIIGTARPSTKSRELAVGAGAPRRLRRSVDEGRLLGETCMQAEQ
jgi:hypothetical protein